MPPRPKAAEKPATTPIPDEPSPDFAAGYQAGYQDGIRAAYPEAPLFEACRTALTPGQTELEAEQAIMDVEHTRGERLSTADRDLLMQHHRRIRTLQHRWERAQREPGMPARQLSDRQKRYVEKPLSGMLGGDAGHGPVEYEHIT